MIHLVRNAPIPVIAIGASATQPEIQLLDGHDWLIIVGMAACVVAAAAVYHLGLCCGGGGEATRES